MTDRKKNESVVTPEILPTHPTKEQIPANVDLPSHWHDLTWKDSAEFLAEAASAVPLAGPAIKKGVEIALGLGQYDREERLQALQWRWLLEKIPAIEQKIDVLLKHLPSDKQPEAADVAAVFGAVIQASKKTADVNKRRLLKNALINAFDPEQYQAGLTLRLISILEDLEYGDVELLGKISKAEQSGFNEMSADLEKVSVEHKKQVAKAQLIFGEDALSLTSIVLHHLNVLEKYNLVIIEDYSREREFAEITRRVRSWERVLAQRDPYYLIQGEYTRLPDVTQLGHRLLQLIMEESSPAE